MEAARACEMLGHKFQGLDSSILTVLVIRIVIKGNLKRLLVFFPVYFRLYNAYRRCSSEEGAAGNAYELEIWRNVETVSLDIWNVRSWRLTSLRGLELEGMYKNMGTVILSKLDGRILIFRLDLGQTSNPSLAWKKTF